MQGLLASNPQFQKMGVLGRGIIARMEAAQKRQDGADAVKALMEELGDLYKEAIVIRANMFPDVMKKVTGVKGKMTVDEALIKNFAPLLDSDNKDLQSIGKDLSLMAVGLAENPADVLGRSAKSRYWYNRGSIPDIKQEAVDTDIQRIQSIGNSKVLRDFVKDPANNNPKSGQLFQAITSTMKGLQELKRINPVEAMRHAWKKNTAGNSMDTRPLRALGLIGFGGLAMVGVAYSLISKSPINKLTLTYAGLAYFVSHPDALDPAAKKAIAAFDQFNQNDLKFIRKFTPAAIEELQGVPAANVREAKKILAGRDLTSDADIGLITNGNKELLKVLKTLSRDEKSWALQKLWKAPKQFVANAKEIAKLPRG
ncbi:hypothetical protein EXS65_03490 [Candidatus Peribacteria bacterium]|nr:hypothetical protein [Candidatus Peribacteria bacterium]